MINAQMEIIIIASLAASACAIPGVFLVLRKMTMLSDAISHSIILGIVLAFFVIQTIDSPFLVMAAGLTGIVMVLFVEWLNKTKLVKEDAAIGVVYPLMFSIAIVLISLFASQIHLDTDSVLMGELAFAPLNRFHVRGADLGPMAYYQIGGVLLANTVLLILFYKDIKISLFDEDYAKAMGLKPKRIQYGLLVVVSFTTVVAFEVAGSILVVGFIVGPAVVAALITRRLWLMVVLAPLIGIAASLTGYLGAHILNVSIAGSIVTTIGVFFILMLVVGPNGGVLARSMRKKKRYANFTVNMLLVHLWQHEALGDSAEECLENCVAAHLNWDSELMGSVIRQGSIQGYLIAENGMLRILPAGIERAKTALEH